MDYGSWSMIHDVFHLHEYTFGLGIFDHCSWFMVYDLRFMVEGWRLGELGIGKLKVEGLGG